MRIWSWGFCVGSALATFSQGCVLGAFIQGFKVEGRNFAGTSMDWLTPFSVLTGVALMLGYGLLGAGWLIIKTEGDLQAWARRMGKICLIGVLVAMAVVSIWTPLRDPAIAHKWFGWPQMILLAPVPILTALLAVLEWQRARRLRRGPAALRGRDGAVLHVLYGHRGQPLADDRAAALHAVGDGLLGGHAGLPADRHACSCCP